MSEGLPGDWILAPLAELALLKTGPFGSALHKSDYLSGGVPVVNPMHIVRGQIVPGDDSRIGGALLKTLADFQLAEGDVVLGRRGEMGRCAVVGAQEAGWLCGTGSLILRPLGALEPRYLQRFLSSPGTVQRLEGASVGSTMVNLNQGILRGLDVPLAPLAEQTRIADKLDALLARVDALRGRLDHIPGILKRFRQSVLAAATSGELTREWREENQETETVAALLERVSAPSGKDTGRAAGVERREGRCALSVGPSARRLPASWLCVPLVRLAKLESGHTPSRTKPSYWDGDISWIGIKDARENHGKVIKTTFQSVSDEGLANSAARLLPARTVCLSRTASVGYVAIMGRSMATSQDFANWICTPALLPEYLMYAFLAEGEGLRDFGEGTTHTTIYFPELKALHICLPPVEEQAAIVGRLETLLAFADQLDARLAKATLLAEALPSAVLAKAFRGALVPQDPNDEPAPAMLARLRQGSVATTDASGQFGSRRRRSESLSV